MKQPRKERGWSPEPRRVADVATLLQVEPMQLARWLRLIDSDNDVAAESAPAR